MTLRCSRTILNPPLDDPPYRGPGKYEGEVDMGDYPWIPQVINESRMFPKLDGVVPVDNRPSTN